MRFLIYITLFIFSVSIQSNEMVSENTIKEFQNEILNNDNIGKLEVNYIYSKMLVILEKLEEEKEPIALIYYDYDYVISYVSELLDRDINKEEIEKIWNYIKENSSKSKLELIKGRDKILKDYL